MYNPPLALIPASFATLLSLAKLYPALPNKYKASFPFLVVIKLNLPTA